MGKLRILEHKPFCLQEEELKQGKKDILALYYNKDTLHEISVRLDAPKARSVAFLEYKDKIHYDKSKKSLSFTGRMTKGEKVSLLVLSKRKEYIRAIENLFKECNKEDTVDGKEGAVKLKPGSLPKSLATILKLEHRIFYDEEQETISFKGVMRKYEKEELLRLSEKEKRSEEAIKRLFRKSQSRNKDTRHVTSVRLDAPKARLVAFLEYKDKIHYDKRKKSLSFTGRMTKDEKESLLGLSTDSKYGDTVKALYAKCGEVTVDDKKSAEKLDSLPKSLATILNLKHRIFYDEEQDVISLKEVMTNDEKRALLRLSENEECSEKAIERLFQESQTAKTLIRFMEEKHGPLVKKVEEVKGIIKNKVCPYCSEQKWWWRHVRKEKYKVDERFELKEGICFECKYGSIGVSRRMLGKVPILDKETRVEKERLIQRRVGDWLKLSHGDKDSPPHPEVKRDVLRIIREKVLDDGATKTQGENPDIPLLIRKGAGYVFFYTAVELGISAAINTGDSYHYFDYLSVSLLLDESSYKKGVRIRQVYPFESVSSKDTEQAIKKWAVGELTTGTETKKEVGLSAEAAESASLMPKILPKIEFSHTSTEELKKTLNSILVQRSTYLGHWPPHDAVRDLVCIDLQGTFKEPIPNTTTHVLWLEIPAYINVLLKKKDSNGYAVLCTLPVRKGEEHIPLERYLKTFDGSEVEFPIFLDETALVEQENVKRVGDVILKRDKRNKRNNKMKIEIEGQETDEYTVEKLVFLPITTSIKADVVALGIIHIPRRLRIEDATGEVIGEYEGKKLHVFARSIRGYRKVIMEKPFTMDLWQDYGVDPEEAGVKDFFKEMVPEGVSVRLRPQYPYPYAYKT